MYRNSTQTGLQSALFCCIPTVHCAAWRGLLLGRDTGRYRHALGEARRKIPPTFCCREIVRKVYVCTDMYTYVWA